MLPEPSVLLDTTLRDGEQAPGVALSPSDKAEYVRLAEAAGIRYIEVGFPQNPLDLDACRAAVRAAKSARLVAMALTTRESVTLVSEIGAHEVLFVVPSSYDHLARVFGYPYEALRDHLLDSIAAADAAGLAVNVGLEDASHGDMDLVFRLLDDLSPVGEKISCITVPDTRGKLLPHETTGLLGAIRPRLPSTRCRLAFHAHNDLGLATANTLSALLLDPPVDCVHVTTCGFGERAGNASLEQIAAILTLKLQRDTGPLLDHLPYLCAYTERIFGTPSGAHAPIIGAKVFSHESGLHQKALLQDTRTYQFLDPKVFGRRTELVLGKTSGRHFREFLARCAECTEDEVTALQTQILSHTGLALTQGLRRRFNSVGEIGIAGLSIDEAVEILRRSKVGEDSRGSESSQR